MLHVLWQRQSWLHRCKYGEINEIIEMTTQILRTPFVVIIFECVRCVQRALAGAHVFPFTRTYAKLIWCGDRFVTLKNNISVCHSHAHTYTQHLWRRRLFGVDTSLNVLFSRKRKSKTFVSVVRRCATLWARVYSSDVPFNNNNFHTHRLDTSVTHGMVLGYVSTRTFRSRLGEAVFEHINSATLIFIRIV